MAFLRINLEHLHNQNLHFMKQVFSVLSVIGVAFFAVILTTTNTGCKKAKDGAKGDTGTANVMYSPWLDVTYSPATNSAGDTVIWFATITAPKITATILDSGVVKAYINIGTASNKLIFPLPITDLYALTSITQLQVYFTPGKIQLYCDVDGGTFITSGQKAQQYRYVVIPGGVPTGRSAINWNDYYAVKQYFNIPD
jgi:hypothetical protein